ncbi:MAG: phosphate signaling complex protein PhoU [Erysipelotrichaceae bacterium]|nr:phosphate signaling complex protein PhoU [Erysipelotrichaceae bacterium]
MRKKFLEELNALNIELISMGSMCGEAIAITIKETLQNDYDGALYEKVSKLEDDIDRKEKYIEALCMKMIYSWQPVAKDLRFINAILRMIADLERIGDQALDIANLLKEFKYTTLIKDTDLPKMFNTVLMMVNESVRAFVKRDINLAKEVIAKDNEVDEIFLNIKNQVIILIEKEDNSRDIVDILMIAKYLERIGDHSVNIAEWVVYTVKGDNYDIHTGR